MDYGAFCRKHVHSNSARRSDLILSVVICDEVFLLIANISIIYARAVDFVGWQL